MTRPRTIGAAELDVLARSTVEGLVLRLPEQLDRKLYLSVDKVLKALGGRWDRKRGGHAFPDDPRARIAEVLDAGEYERPEDHGHFPTPAPVAARLVELAELADGMRVLEPSAGTGNLVRACLAAARVSVTAVELQEANLRAFMSPELALVVCSDFLRCTTESLGGPFDRVVMNPPFARGADVDHVRHAFGMLAPGGVLVSVMSAGTEFRQDRKTVDFRVFRAAYGGSSEALPPGSFKESGTGVHTIIVKIRRRA